MILLFPQNNPVPTAEQTYAQPLLPQQTIHYKTYLKRALVEAFDVVFKNHPDEIIRQHTKVDIDLPLEQAAFPAIVIRFYERQIHNAGVDHIELIQNPSGRWQNYKHYMYTGDIEFAIYALSSYDRDILSDAVVQVLAMSDLEWYTNHFYYRIYDSLDPDSFGHFVNINTDQVSGFGENQVVAPWMAEDTLVYQTSYRVGTMGEFYSRMLDVEYDLVENVPAYPYQGVDEDGTDPVPTGDPADMGVWEVGWFDPNIIVNDQG